MLSRCTNASVPSYRDYGARGIKVCTEWHQFENFLRDMGERPNNHSIDRIENDGNYEPSNCRWSTRSEQNNNRRSSALVTFKGKTQTLAKWSSEIGFSHDVIGYRLRSGWSVQRALTTPVRKQKNNSLHTRFRTSD